MTSADDCANCGRPKYRGECLYCSESRQALNERPDEQAAKPPGAVDPRLKKGWRSADVYFVVAAFLGIGAVVSWVAAGYMTLAANEATDFDDAKAIQAWTLAGYGLTAAAIILIGLGLLAAAQNFFEWKAGHRLDK